MNIDLRHFELWEQCNAIANRQLHALHPKLDPKAQVQVFQNQGHALFDIFLGLRQFFPHKKSVVAFDEGSPYLNPNLSAFYRDAYQVDLKRHEILKEQTVESFVATLPKDLLCVVYARDHAFTGEIYNQESLDSLLKTLNGLKIPTIQLMHAYQNHHSWDSLPFSISILQEKSYSTAVLGGRIKTVSASAPYTSVSPHHLKESKLTGESPRADQRIILEAEELICNLSEGKIKPFFDPSQTARIWDRSLFNLSPLSSLHFKDRLLKSFHGRGDYSDDIDVVNSCFWGGFGPARWWGQPALSSDTQRGLVAISTRVLEIPDFARIFVDCFSACICDSKLI